MPTFGQCRKPPRALPVAGNGGGQSQTVGNPAPTDRRANGNLDHLDAATASFDLEEPQKVILALPTDLTSASSTSCSYGWQSFTTVWSSSTSGQIKAAMEAAGSG